MPSEPIAILMVLVRNDQRTDIDYTNRSVMTNHRQATPTSKPVMAEYNARRARDLEATMAKINGPNRDRHMCPTPEETAEANRLTTESLRKGSWHPFTMSVRRSIVARAKNTAPRIARATRTSRITTGRRTTTMAASSSSGGGDDSGGELPHDPAPLGAEGRATGGASDDSGPWLTSIEEQRLHREMAQRARSRSRYMRDVRGMRGWSS